MKKIVLMIFGLFIFVAAFVRSFSDFSVTDICIVYTTDIRGRIELLPRLSATLKKIRSECGENVLLINNGGSFDGKSMEMFHLKGSGVPDPVAYFLKEEGYDFTNVPISDFRYGRQFLQRHMEDSKTVPVTMNLSGFSSESKKSIDGIDIAVVGLVPPVGVEELPRSFLEGVEVKNPMRSASKVLARLEENADFTVVAAYSEEGDDYFEYHTDQPDFVGYLYQNFPGLKLILEGRTGSPSGKRVNDNTVILHAGTDLSKVGVAKLKVIKKSGGKTFLSDMKWKLYSVESKPDEKMSKAMKPYVDLINRIEKGKSGVLTFGITEETPDRETPLERALHYNLHSQAKRHGEAVDFSLLQYDCQPVPAEEGSELTFEMIDKIYPFFDFPNVVTIKAEKLLSILNDGAKNSARISLFPLRYDISEKSGVVLRERFRKGRTYRVVMPGRLLRKLKEEQHLNIPAEAVLPVSIRETLFKDFPEVEKKFQTKIQSEVIMGMFGKESKRFLNMHKRLETAIVDYDMIDDGDHVIVGLSGGKDSNILLRLMARKKIMTTNDFKLSAAFVRQGFEMDDEKAEFLEAFCRDLGVPFYVVDAPVRKLFEERKEKPCYICSRVRRMAIFSHAESIGATKIAFGHHKDDFIETFMMNIYFSHEIATMKPFNPFFKGKFFVIRPMLYVDEKMIKEESEGMPVFRSGCPYEVETERTYVKNMLNDLYRKSKKIKPNIFRAMFSPKVEYLLKEPSSKSALK